ncbi:MAG TPA: hypothetical protein VEY09_09840 [Pyrinomonadaceae bacterium]|nr:hypothetical protein [Pyrinomonadaceae bacterium]
MLKVAPLALLLALAAAPAATGEQPVKRFDTRRPAVYITLEGVSGGGEVTLRLHNNSLQAIHFSMPQGRHEPSGVTPYALASGRVVDALADDASMTPAYFVRHESGGRTNHAGCVMLAAWLRPNRSALFTVPRDHLKAGDRVHFYYLFESEVAAAAEVDHEVGFSADELQRDRAGAAGDN